MMTLIPVFLAFQGPAGETTHVQLPRSELYAITFLPNSCEHGIDLSHCSNETHSVIRIHFLLLSIWESQHGDVSILTSSGDLVKLPLLTTSETKSCILLDGSQFVSWSGRWTIEFDNDYSISNSMRSPPLWTTSPINHAFHPVFNDRELCVDGVGDSAEQIHNDDSGFFENVVPETTNVLTVKTPVPAEQILFGKEGKSNEKLQDMIAEAFEQHRSITRDGRGTHNKDEAPDMHPQTHTCQAEPPIDGLEQRLDTNPVTEPSASVHSEEVDEVPNANCDTAPDDSLGNEAKSEEHADALRDHKEPSQVSREKVFSRTLGVKSQQIPQATAADPSKHAAGHESLCGDRQTKIRVSQASPSHGTLDLYRREAGQELQAIPTETVLERHQSQTAQESQDVLQCPPVEDDERRLNNMHQFPPSGRISGPPKRSLGQESQALQLQDSSGNVYFDSPASGGAPASFTPVATQTATISAYCTLKVSRFMGTPEPPKQKRKFSVSTDTELSESENGLRGAHLIARVRTDNQTTSEVSTMSTRHTRDSSTPKPRLIGDSDQDSDTITVNVSQSTRNSKPRQIQAESSVRLPSNLKVVFSLCKIQNKPNTMAKFHSLGGTIVDSVAEADILCVPNVDANNELKKTPKLLLAIILGKVIVTEKWIMDCHSNGQRKKKFPDPRKYLPLDTARERSWKFNLTAALKRGQQPGGKLQKLLDDRKVFVTPQLHKKISCNWDGFKDVAMKMGAKGVYIRLPTNARMTQALVLGDEEDADAVSVGKLGYRLYKKDVLTMAVLRGKLELDSAEFELEMPVKEEPESQN